jgi:hypothetical protein
MSQQNPNSASGFIGGMVLVLVLHVLFSIFWVGFCYVTTVVFKVPRISDGYNVLLLLFAPLIFFGIVQIVYLLPAYVYFAKKGRSEVCKGIVVGGLVTLMVNGACSGGLLTGMGSAISVGIVATALIIGMVGIWSVTRPNDRR